MGKIGSICLLGVFPQFSSIFGSGVAPANKPKTGRFMKFSQGAFRNKSSM